MPSIGINRLQTDCYRQCREVLRDFPTLVFGLFIGFLEAVYTQSVFHARDQQKIYFRCCTMSKFSSGVWPSMLSIYYTILLVTFLEFTCNSTVTWYKEGHTKILFCAKVLTSPYAGWIFHQQHQQRAGRAERVSKTKPHRCVSILKRSIMYHPLLFLTQHLSSQHNSE